MAVEVNSDPSTRNLRVAVLVVSEKARQAIVDVAANRIFTRMAEAKPMEQIV